MPLDPVIAGGFRGLQLQDPLEQYGRISQIQQAQQQNQLAALKMQEYRRGVETQNRLRSLDPSAANYMTEVMRLDPELGSQLMLRSKQQTAAERAAAASEAEGRAKNLSYWQGLARDSARTPTDDVVAGLARRAVELGVTDEGTASSQLQQLLAMPPEQRGQVLAQYGASAAAPPAAPATPADVATMQALGFPLTQQGYEQFRAAQRQPPTYTPSPDMQGYELAKSEGYKGTFFDYQRQLAEAKRPLPQPREAKDDPRAVVAFRETDAAGNVTLLNKFGEVITPTAPVKGKPSATFEKTTAQRKQLSIDLDRAIIELTDAAKPGGLIDRSTGSGAGQLRDIAMGFGGYASSGAIAGSELAPIADLVLKMVPRFEGPQSNKDTTSYEKAAGQLANTALPNAQRKAAAEVLIRLMTERKGQFVSAAMAAEGTGPARPSLDSIFK
jgi:hypothetical protein